MVDTHYNGPRPNNYMILTVITLCCCMGWPALFCSIIAIIHSMQVSTAGFKHLPSQFKMVYMYMKFIMVLGKQGIGLLLQQTY